MTDIGIDKSLVKPLKKRATNLSSFFNITNYLKSFLKFSNVPFTDNCCPNTDNNPVRTNDLGVLQTLEDGVWVDVPVGNSALTFSEGVQEIANAVTLGGTISSNVQITGATHPNMFIQFDDTSSDMKLVNQTTGIRFNGFATNIGDVHFLGNATLITINDGDQYIALGPTVRVDVANRKIDFDNYNLDEFTLTNKTVATSTYTLLPTDSGKVINFTNAGGVSITVSNAFPNNLPVGFTVTLVQQGAGPISFATVGTTINNRQGHFTSAGQYAILSLFSTSLNTFVLGGDTI